MGFEGTQGDLGGKAQQAVTLAESAMLSATNTTAEERAKAQNDVWREAQHAGQRWRYRVGRRSQVVEQQHGWRGGRQRRGGYGPQKWAVSTRRQNRHTELGRSRDIGMGEAEGGG